MDVTTNVVIKADRSKDLAARGAYGSSERGVDDQVERKKLVCVDGGDCMLVRETVEGIGVDSLKRWRQRAVDGSGREGSNGSIPVIPSISILAITSILASVSILV